MVNLLECPENGEAWINRAKRILMFASPKQAIDLLVADGINPIDATHCVIAAMILCKDQAREETSISFP